MAATIPFSTINVVPAGFKWTPEAAQKAQAKGAFLRVGGTQVSRRFLSGAKRSWTSTKPEENRTIFHTGYRITGTPESVVASLRYANIPDDQIQAVLDSAITRDNFNTIRADTVKLELDAHNAAKQAKPVTEGYGVKQLLWFGQNIKSAVIATKTGEQKGTVTSPGRAGESLGDKIRKLAAGKVLDVSNIDIVTGKGYRTTNTPKTAKAGKYGTGRLPIISNDLNKYIRAIQLAYGPEGETTYAQDIAVVRHALSNVGAPVAVAPIAFMTGAPAPAPVPVRASPARVPGATLAPQPIFAPVPVITTPRTTVGTTLPPPITTGGAQYPFIPALAALTQPAPR